MKGFLLVFVSFASIISVSHSLQFCESLAANNGSISYSLSVPMEGPINKNYLIIKDQYWELVFDNNSVNPLPLTFSDKESKQSEWLKGDNYQLAFAVRFGIEGQDVWNFTSIGLMDFKAENFDWALFPKDMSNGLDATSTVLETNFRFTPNPSDPDALQPSIAYSTYSRRRQNSIVFIEQKMSATTGQYELRIQAYNTSNPNLRLDNETNSPWFQPPANTPPPNGQWIVPTAVKETNRSLYIAALYGLSTNNGTNGMIILFANNLIYSYCITDEYYLWPECLSNNMSILIDCTNTESTTSGGSGQTNVTVDTVPPDLVTINPDGSSSTGGGGDSSTGGGGGGDSSTGGGGGGGGDSSTGGGGGGGGDSSTGGGGGRDGSSNSGGGGGGSESAQKSSNGSNWWIYLLIVFIIIIIIVVIVFFVMKGSRISEADKKAGEEGEALSSTSAAGAGAAEAIASEAGSGGADAEAVGVAPVKTEDMSAPPSKSGVSEASIRSL